MMAFKLVINPEARVDLSEAIAYYDGQREGLGREFADCVEEVFVKVLASPTMFAEIYRSIRQTLVRRFPFVVCYRIVENEVRIIAVYHGRQDPKSWKSRVGKSH